VPGIKTRHIIRNVRRRPAPAHRGIHLVEVTLDRDRFGLEIIIDGLERRLG
jgi:hypothetical protein